MKKMTSQKNIASAMDVGKLAKVSQSAVSRAFTKGASISPKTKQRVLDAAKTLGYRPNILARCLINGRSNIIGVALGSLQNEFYSLVLEALSKTFSAHGLRLLMFTASPDEEVDQQINDLLHYQVDALILLSTSLSSTLADSCFKAGIPVVFFNRTSNVLPEICSVTGNNHDGAIEIARHLIDQGYQNLAFMAGYPNSSTSNERQTAFVNYIKNAGLPAPLIETGYFSREGSQQAARKLLARKTPPDAIFCASDQMALATIDVAKHEFNLKIGDDIGIVGFDDIPTASWPSYQLTTYSQPIDLMAKQTLAYVLAGDKQNNKKHSIITGKLIIRNSTLPQE